MNGRDSPLNVYSTSALALFTTLFVPGDQIPECEPLTSAIIEPHTPH